MANPNEYAINTAQFSMQLLRGQMVNYLMTGEYTGGLSLNEFILGKSTQTETPKPALPQSLESDVLTRLVRSNSGALRLDAENMRENGFIVSIAGKAFGEISDKLAAMQGLAAQAGKGGANKSALQESYNSLAADIAGIVKQSEYNGVNLLDGSTWPDEERVSSADGYNTGKLGTRNDPAQNAAASSGKVPAEITLFSLSSFKETFHEKDLDNLPLTGNKLASAQSMVASVKNSYEARAGLYNTEASSLERQAGILDRAAQKARPGDERRLKDAIVDILLRDQGGIIEAAS